MIIIDNREPQTIFDAFDKCGINFELTKLSVGDFTNNKGSFIAERKGFRDFWSSMIDKRIYEQTRRMYEEYSENRYIFVEFGCLADLAYERKKNINWIYSLFGTIENWSVHFREYLDLEDLARKLDALDKKLGSEKRIREKRLKHYNATIAEKWLMDVPNMGSKLAKAAIKACGSFEGVLNDLYGQREKLSSVKGLSKNGKILEGFMKEVKRKHK